MRMPVLFVGHGSPMNAIEDNPFTRQWDTLSEKLPRPKAILCVSAHWFTPGTRVMDSATPRTIHDMYGFPKELYRILYDAPGSPSFAHKTQELMSNKPIIDNTWGLDHGAWSVLRRVYPKADIPVFQLSIDRHASPREHYNMGRQLADLREQGVLLFGSGNVVHNLARLQWEMEGGFPWADAFDNYIKESIRENNHDNVIQFEKAGSSASLAFTTLDHFAPLLYVLGASLKEDPVAVFNDDYVYGSISMTSYLLG
jgi:4,5-DOPA dioxygenase extradiol